MTRRLYWGLAALLFAAPGLLGAAADPALARYASGGREGPRRDEIYGGRFDCLSTRKARVSERALPAATAANPKYRSQGSDLERRWLTKEIEFHRGENGGLTVSTRESFEDYRAARWPPREPTRRRLRSTMSRFPMKSQTMSRKTAGRRAGSCFDASALPVSRRYGAAQNRSAASRTYTCKTLPSENGSSPRSELFSEEGDAVGRAMTQER